MKIKYHGNWCGPGWSDGKYQSSVRGFAPAIDEFDETCRQHDFQHADGHDLDLADARFVEDNFGTSLKRSAAALAVYANHKLRNTVQNNNQQIMPKINNSSSRLRGNNGQRKPTKPVSTSSMQNNTTRSGNDVFRSAPVSISARRTGTKPVISTTKTGIVVSHRTFLAPVENSILFTVDSYATNPGLGSTFPWLSKIASRYDKYRFKKLRFEYRSVCATSTSGVAMMSFDYDAADDVPVSKQDQAQTIPNAENNVWMNNDLTVPCDSTWRFVRQGTVPNTDIKTYDLGNMHLSTIYGNGVTTGELYVEYIVELDKPTEPAALAMTIASTSAFFGTPLTPSVVTGKAQPFLVVNGNTLTCLVPGTYVFNASITGTLLLTSINPTTTGSTAVTTLTNLLNASFGIRSFRVVVEKGDILGWINCYTGTTLTSLRVDITEFF